MQFLKMLQEASEADLEAVKVALKKDPNTKVLFQSASTLNDVRDKGVFLSTLKFHLLNNKKVKEFALSRTVDKESKDVWGGGAVKNVSTYHFNSLRQLQEKDLNEGYFDQIKLFVKDLFSEHASVQRGTISAQTKKELKDWVNGNGRHFNLSKLATAELTSLPNLRPTEKIVLYRGILFKKWDMEKTRDYDKSSWENPVMKDGNGMAFLKSIRPNTKIVDLEWNNPSSWTTSKNVAERFAKYGPADSSFGATMQWLQRGAENRAIDGELGFVLAIFADPKDIILDVDKLGELIPMQHGSEGEVILKPGKYFAKIVKRYTVSGEVPPEGKDTNSGTKIVQEMHYEIKKLEDLKLKQLLNKVPKSYLHNDPRNRENTFEFYDNSIFSDIPRLQMVFHMTDEIHAAIEKYQEIIKRLHEKFKDVNLTTDMIDPTDEEQVKQLKIVQEVMKSGTDRTRSSHFKDGYGPYHELPRDKLRMSKKEPSIVKELIDNLKHAGGTVRLRINGRELGSWFDYHYKLITGKGVSSRFDMLGEAKQKPAVDTVLKDFLPKFGVTFKEDDYKANLENFKNIFVRCWRNAKLLSDLNNLEYKLSGREE